jgi:predicted peptidase
MLGLSDSLVLVLSFLAPDQPPAASQPGAPPRATQPATKPNAAQVVASQPATVTGFLNKWITIDGETYAYCVYLPPDYTPDHPWPVILFLHGAGERGSDGLLQSEVGIGSAIRRHVSWFRAIVVMPQCRVGQPWVGKMNEMALRCVEQTAREYPLDPQRVYVTGLSLGGQGAWHLAAQYPRQFAAAMPICGFAGSPRGESKDSAAQVAARVKDMPIWCFHGVRDEAVPVEKSREIIAALEAAGAAPKYTEVPDGTHNVWDRAYGDPELWKWLFAQKLEKQKESSK